jgi:hypothetical protein
MRSHAALLALAASALFWCPIQAHTETWLHGTLYVDAVTGSDRASGDGPQSAWKTLAPLSAAHVGPGCRVLLKAGGVYAGPLSLNGAGSAQAPVRVGRYGNGPAPGIVCSSGPAVHLIGVEYCEVSDLDLTGGSTGVLVESRPSGVTRALAFRRLHIHDIHGGSTGDDGGFLIRRTGRTASFADLRIEECVVEHADRNGILLTDWPAEPDDPRSTRVVIRGNRLSDIGGDGIFILGCEGAIVERNVLRYAHQRVGRGPGERACAGIWPQRSNNTLIQYNEVSHTADGGKTVWDSEAFDDDGGCRGTIFQYNWSHDNAGGFLLNCGGVGTIVRYNISQNDRTATFSFESDGVRDSLIANNTIYVGRGLRVQLARNTFGSPSGIVFANDLIYSDGEVFHSGGRIRGLQFKRCCLFGDHPGLADRDVAIAGDPMLENPGHASDGRASAVAYRLRRGSACARAGMALPNDGGRDFFGAELGSAPRSIGAHQP